MNRLQKKFGLMGTDAWSKEMNAVKEAARSVFTPAVTWMTAFMGVKANPAEEKL